ncbi:MAG: GC-type dockerin domain-anchored protein [Phycisphaerales bacterium]
MRTVTAAATIPFCVAISVAASSQAGCSVTRLRGPDGLSLAFGSSLTVNDRHILISDNALSICPGGDPFECTAGSVNAFELVDGRWVRAQPIIPPDIQFNDGFGLGTVLDPRNPNRAIVLTGRRFYGDRMGHGHVYEFDGEAWRETARFDAPTGHPFTTFGFTSSLHGDTMLINQSARVHLYRDVAGAWVYQDSLRVPDFMVPSPSPNFGRGGMALDDQWAFIGAHRDETRGFSHGSVVVYRRQPDGSLALAQYLLPPLDASGRLPEAEFFGADLDFDGRTLVVGAPRADRDFDVQGVAYVYELEGDQWVFRQELRSPTPGMGPEDMEEFGGGISVLGDRLIIGYLDSNSLMGQAHVFRRGADGVWDHASVLRPGVAAPTYPSGFGYRATQNGRWAVLNAMAEGETGAAYVFDLDCILGACNADLDDDGRLTLFDYLAFSNAFDAADPIADLDGDGEFTLLDFAAFRDAFDAGCS